MHNCVLQSQESWMQHVEHQPKNSSCLVAAVGEVTPGVAEEVENKLEEWWAGTTV